MKVDLDDLENRLECSMNCDQDVTDLIIELRAAREVMMLAKAWKSSHLSVDEIRIFKAIDKYDEACNDTR